MASNLLAMAAMASNLKAIASILMCDDLNETIETMRPVRKHSYLGDRQRAILDRFRETV